MKYLKKHYQQTLKLLVLLSSPATLQREAHGIGHAEEELAIDLEFHFTEHKKNMMQTELLNAEQLNLIEEIEHILTQKSSDQDETFWHGLEGHPDWQTIRVLASTALIALGKENLTIKVNVSTTTSWFSKNVTSQEIDVIVIDNG